MQDYTNVYELFIFQQLDEQDSEGPQAHLDIKLEAVMPRVNRLLLFV